MPNTEICRSTHRLADGPHTPVPCQDRAAWLSEPPSLDAFQERPANLMQESVPSEGRERCLKALCVKEEAQRQVLRGLSHAMHEHGSVFLLQASTHHTHIMWCPNNPVRFCQFSGES